MIFSKYFKLTATLCTLLLFAFTAPTWADPHGIIHGVEVTFDNAHYDGIDTLRIVGNLENNGGVVVTLGQSSNLILLSLSNSEILVACPGFECQDGDYLLTVQLLGTPYLAEYALTIGAVGPEGPQGPQGPQGPAGDPATDTSAATQCGMDEVLLGSGQCLSILDLVCTVQAKTVFVTSTRSRGNLGGLAGADATCNSLARTAGLSGHFKAWLSDGTESPSSRFTPSSCPYYRVDGVKVADDWNDLTDGTLDAPISLDQNGASRAAGGFSSSELVWTNTQTDGTANGTTDNDHCADWTVENNMTGQYGGVLDLSDSSWTDSQIFIGVCSDRKRLYCIQQ